MCFSCSVSCYFTMTVNQNLFLFCRGHTRWQYIYIIFGAKNVRQHSVEAWIVRSTDTRKINVGHFVRQLESKLSTADIEIVCNIFDYQPVLYAFFTVFKKSLGWFHYGAKVAFCNIWYWHLVLCNQLNVVHIFGMQFALIRTLTSWRLHFRNIRSSIFCMHVFTYLVTHSERQQTALILQQTIVTCIHTFLEEVHLDWEPLLIWRHKNKPDCFKALVKCQSKMILWYRPEI